MTTLARDLGHSPKIGNTRDTRRGSAWDTPDVGHNVRDLRELWRRLEPWADPALALLVLGMSLQPMLKAEDCGCEPVPLWGYLLVVAQCVPLAFRRRWPFMVAVLVGGPAIVHGVSSLPEPPISYAALIAVYSVAAHATSVRAKCSGFVTAVAVVSALLFDRSADFNDYTVNILLYTTAWLLGDGTRRRRERAQALEERSEQLERTRTAEAQAAVSAERNRIAREMHDVVAHHISMMVVQAEAGPVVVANDPGRATEAFDNISAAGKRALTEMRRMLGVLRTDSSGDGGAPLAPQPGAQDIEDLVDGVRAAGVDVRLRIGGDVQPVPPAVGLSAYRLVQEALTNVVRHAGPARVDVDLRYDPGTLRISVTDDGAGAAVPQRNGGHGLVAMRERVTLVGGELEARPRPDRGWMVRAVLPFDHTEVR